MKEKKSNFKKILIILILVILGITLYGRYINTKGLIVHEYGVKSKELPISFHGLQIIHFSDIHYGQTTSVNDLQKMVTKINELKPDIVVFTGDLFNKNIKLSNDEIENITKELEKIKPTLFKYSISGDTDLNNYNDYQKIMTESNFILLNNSNELLYYKGDIPIKIVGIIDNKDLESAFKEETVEQSFTILLLHQPDQIDNLNNYRVDIALAGHSLGGLIKVPFIGGIIKKDGANKYIAEYHKVNNTEFYVSSGIGTDNIKFRMFNKPSINLYRLYTK